MTQLKEAVIVASRRSAVGKAPRGVLRNTRPDDLGIEVLKKTLESIEELDLSVLDDVQIGSATPEAEQGLNVARMIALGAGLPNSSSAVTVNRFCSSTPR